MKKNVFNLLNRLLHIYVLLYLFYLCSIILTHLVIEVCIRLGLHCMPTTINTVLVTGILDHILSKIHLTVKPSKHEFQMTSELVYSYSVRLPSSR